MANHPSIFISYRKADALGQAGRLHQSLEAVFGKGSVFYDNSDLKPGMIWPGELDEKVRRAAVVLVLIADRSRWLGVDDQGSRRIDDPDDWVRKEVEAALGDSQKLVVPVLFNNAQLPTEKGLPETLRVLLAYQSKQIREANWDDDLLPFTIKLREHLNHVDPGPSESGQGKKSQPTDQSFHAFTCDRDTQYEQFYNLRPTLLQPGSRHFFYLYGEELQAHESFFNRVKFDLDGKYLKKENDAQAVPIPENEPNDQPQINQPDKKKDKKPTVAAVSFVVESGGAFSPENLRQRFVRDLYTAFGLDPGKYHPLTGQNLNILLAESDKTRHLRSGDHLCVFAYISHWFWNSKLTPDAARWFVQTFCPPQLPPDSPSVIFFFAFDFNEEESPGVREDVLATIKREAQHVVALPELEMVEIKHIQQWFVRYKRYFSAALRQQIVATHFTEPKYYMDLLEPKLLKLVNDYFNKLTE
ncbi:MAG: TIR domain-containing protein [Saprospiraceae bacterium]